MNEKEMIENIIEWILEKKGEDIVIIDMERDILVDSFIIASTGSKPHLEALSENIISKIKEYSLPYRVDGTAESEWVVIDLGIYMIHLFTDRMRRLYKIEELGKVREGFKIKNADTNLLKPR